MPVDVSVPLRRIGVIGTTRPHARGTVRRHLANWSMLTNSCGPDDFAGAAVESPVRLAVSAVPGQRGRKSANAGIRDALGKL